MFRESNNNNDGGFEYLIQGSVHAVAIENGFKLILPKKTVCECECEFGLQGWLRAFMNGMLELVVDMVNLALDTKLKIEIEQANMRPTLHTFLLKVTIMMKPYDGIS